MSKAKLTDEEKIQRRLDRANQKMIESVQKRGPLIKTMAPSGGSSGSYFSFQDGREANKPVVERLIECGRIASAGDGLFDDGQTFVVA